MGARFVPQGTPFQQAQRTRTIEQSLRREAKGLRRHADRLERHAAKIEARRLTGKPITDALLAFALTLGPGEMAWRPAALLAGLPVGAPVTRQTIGDAIFGRAQRTTPLPVAPPPPALHRPAREAFGAPFPSIPDPISAATAIVRAMARRQFGEGAP